MTDCVRSITFTIPGQSPGKSDIQVVLTEQSDGSILVDLQALGGNPADLRGLFFDVQHSSILSRLQFAGTDIRSTLVADDGVDDLGQGANMKGHGQPKFDVGVEFGTPGRGQDNVNHTSFVLSTTDGSHLTLDELAHVDFGIRTTSSGQKVIALTPAAPDAHDDAFSIFEDGASGLNDPSTVPAPVLFHVLANDTDADGNALSVTDIHDGPAHGTATISADHTTVIYTPFEDYSGTDSFVYCISDGHGGTDFATANVSVTAVADIPDLTYEIVPGATVNQAIINVTATQTDADSSEFIDRLSLTGTGLPAGFTITPGSVNPGTEPDQITQQFVVTFPIDTDVNVPLTLAAISQETSNGDEQTASTVINIVNDFNHTTTPVEFSAQDQSIWDTGNQFTFADDRFLGVNTGDFNETTGGALFAGISGHVQLGFQSTLTFAGGEIDATSNYDVTVDTNFNRTTDQLLIDTGALLTGADFSTVGPTGSYVLDFIYDVLLDAFAGVNIDLGEIDFDPLGVIPGDQTIDFGSINEQINIPVHLGSGSLNVLDLNSDTLAGSIDFPDPLSAFSVNFAWPNITTSGSLPPNPGTADGASNNFLELDLDIDELVTQLLGLPVNPLDPPRLSAGPFFADADLLDVDVIGGLNFLQHFAMSMGDLTGVLDFEDGSSQAFHIGDSLLINHASDIDLHGNNDGLVQFHFDVVPTATLHNETDLGFNIGAEMKLLSVELGYDVSIDGFGVSDSITLGPLADIGATLPVGDIGVYDNTFALNYAHQNVFGTA
jgi:hypothetical protein